MALEFSTGVGKTLSSIKVIEEILKNNPNARGYLICKERTHIKNWGDDIKKHKKDHVLKKIKPFLYASLHKYKDAVDFIILDECHALTVKRVKELKDIIKPTTQLLFLSATIPDDKKYLMSLLSRKIYFYTITLLEAINMNLLPKPSLMVHKMQLEDHGSHDFTMRASKSKKYVYSSYKDRFKRLSSLKKGTGLIVRCTEVEFYKMITEQMEFYKSKLDEEFDPLNRRILRNKFLSLGSQRKRFLANIKTIRALKIINSFRANNNRFICFTGTIDQSMELGSKSAVHSKNSKDDNQNLIDCFNDESCSELFAVKMLRESVNLTNIEKGLIVQLDGSVGSFYQMLGRCLRHDFPEMHLIVLENTRDEEYFEKAMSDFSKKFVNEKKS